MDASIRFRIATRIHHALIRELGEGIDVVMMLGREPYAREVLHVCNACGNRELVRLARHFRAATEQEERAEREEAALYAAWMRNGSGFRPTQPPAGPSGRGKREDAKRVSEPAPQRSTMHLRHGAGAAVAALAPRRWFGWFGLGVH
jgi:hypothetical protein